MKIHFCSVSNFLKFLLKQIGLVVYRIVSGISCDKINSSDVIKKCEVIPIVTVLESRTNDCRQDFP